MTVERIDRPLSRGDIGALSLFLVLGAVIAVWTLVQSIIRIVEVIPGRDVPVYADFAGTQAQAPIGPGGALVPVELSSAFITAAELPVASVWALVIEQLVLIVTVLTVVSCLLLLTWSFMRGRIFSRRNTVLVAIAGSVGLIGFVLAPFFGNMGANGAFARISDYGFDNVILTVQPLPLIFIAFVAALAGTVFSVGERLQRETDGLI